MQDLIKITYQNDNPTVSARELHEFLEVETPYHKWFPRMCEYGFTEKTDYLVTDIFVPNSNGGKQTQADAQLSVEMGKEIAMLQRTEKGKQARTYFIQLEKAWNSPEKVMARALKIANDTIFSLSAETSKQKQIIGELKPKADYTDLILQNKSLVGITQIAKDYGMSGQALNKLLHTLRVQYQMCGQWLLYRQHQACGYTHSETISFEHSDGRQDTKMQTKFTQKGRLFLYELLKKSGYLPVIERQN